MRVNGVSISLRGLDLQLFLLEVLIVTVKKNSDTALISPLFDVFVLFLLDQVLNFNFFHAFGAVLFNPVRHFVDQSIKQLENQTDKYSLRLLEWLWHSIASRLNWRLSTDWRSVHTGYLFFEAEVL